MKDVLSIIIPTFNNPQFLNPCVLSIYQSGILNGFAELIIVNNGSQPIEKELAAYDNIKVLSPGKNLGWEGGLKLGLEHSKAPFVCFQNDDTHLVPIQSMFYERMIARFTDRNVGAVGPLTTVAAGWQSIYRPGVPPVPKEVPFLIFFCVMLRREYLDAVGGIDDTLPGGDDFDLSIRLRQAGKKLLIDPSTFLIHHGFKTGERVHGGPDVNGGWNSKQMSETTNTALIKKHGFKVFFETISGTMTDYSMRSVFGVDEHALIRREVQAEGLSVLELGCGFKKVFEHSVGVDRVPRGQKIPNLEGQTSIADVVADVTQPLPFEDGEFDMVIAQHVIEHCVDLVKVLAEWTRILKPGGKLVISTPNEDMIHGIPLNPEHCHAFNPDSLSRMMNLLGLSSRAVIDPENAMSFIAIFEKAPALVEAV